MLATAEQPLAAPRRPRDVTGLTMLAVISVMVMSACATSPTTVLTKGDDRPAAPCQVGDLAVDFRGGGMGTGNDIGSLVIRNTSLVPCQLTGKVVVTPLDASGRPIHTYTPMKGVSPPVGLVLSARSTQVPSGQTATDGKVRALLMFAGAERDDPKPPNGMCPAALEVTPASWCVQIAGGTLVVPNHDPGGPAGPPDVRSLYGCRASFFEMSLEMMSAPLTPTQAPPASIYPCDPYRPPGSPCVTGGSPVPSPPGHQ